MCFRPPKPPPLPPPEPRDSAIESTADKVVVGDKRSTSPKRRQQLATPTGRRRLGTRSLQIPLSGEKRTASGNLNYPT
tara:strand:+ start:29 stop:262 length:234 start_codon:yes stop_codon:yes gene_type:complete